MAGVAPAACVVVIGNWGSDRTVTPTPAVLTTRLLLRTMARLSGVEHGKKEDPSWPASSFR